MVDLVASFIPCWKCTFLIAGIFMKYILNTSLRMSFEDGVLMKYKLCKQIQQHGLLPIFFLCTYFIKKLSNCKVNTTVLTLPKFQKCDRFTVHNYIAPQ